MIFIERPGAYRPRRTEARVCGKESHMERKPIALASAVLAVALAFALSTGVAGAARGGNSTAAKACQKGGYLNWTRTDGTAFRRTGECTAYVARRGRLVLRTWQSVCTGELGGAFRQSPTTWYCDFSSATEAEFQSAEAALKPLCPGAPFWIWEPDSQMGTVGCSLGLPG
jgi:hypothetical protein